MHGFPVAGCERAQPWWAAAEREAPDHDYSQPTIGTGSGQHRRLQVSTAFVLLAVIKKSPTMLAGLRSNRKRNGELVLGQRDEPLLDCDHHRLCSRVGVELSQNGRNVVLDGLLCHVEFVGNLLV